MSKYKLTISYDGTNYCGWQIQPTGTTIQELIQNGIKVLLKHEITLIGSGRTDAGVHALEQVAHFKSELDINIPLFLKAINGMLPKDIRILSIEKATNSFHAQYDATSKIYHYHLCLDRYQSPFNRAFSYHVRHQFDEEAFRAAAKHFIGTHDFTAFANEPHKGSASKDPVRTITRLDIIPEPGGLRLEFEGDGFLYKMVRNIVGTLLEISCGKKKIEDLPAIFESKDRKLSGKSAAAHGLFLVKVHYKENA